MGNGLTRREIFKRGVAAAGALALVPEWALPALAQGEVDVPFTDVPANFTFSPPDGARRGRPIERTEVDAPDRDDLLPAPLRPFTRPARYAPPAGRPPVAVPAWHGGAHPHLVHELVSCVTDDRASAIGAERAAAITAPGIVAHASALAGGRMLDIPQFDVG